GLLARVDLARYDAATDPSVVARVHTAGQALAGIRAHPLLGNGAGSFAAIYQDAQGDPGWIGNLELHLLYDSGALGLLAVLAGLGANLAAAWRTLPSAELKVLSAEYPGIRDQGSGIREQGSG